jgi:hypothetical protein
MAIIVDIDATDIIRYIQSLEKAPQEIQKGASLSINRIGDLVVNDVVSEIAGEVGMEEEVIRRALRITKSTPNTMMYRINAEAALIDAPATRPMRGKRKFATKSDNYFQKDELVKVVTMEDDDVCKICERVREGGPYPVGRARDLVPAHPNCRCLIQPIRDKKGRPMAFRKGKSARTSEQVQDKLKEQLRKDIMKAVRAAMRKNRATKVRIGK